MYRTMLKEAVKRSRLSLQQIEDNLNRLGAKTNKAYISKLQNGRLRPPNDTINEAIAEVLNIDPTDLKAAAYLTKIEPDVINRIVEIKTHSKEAVPMNEPKLDKAEAAAPTTTSVDLMEVLENQLSVLTSIQSSTVDARLKMELSAQIVELLDSIVRTADVIDFKNRRYEKYLASEKSTSRKFSI